MPKFLDYNLIDKFLIAADEVGRGPLAGPVVACAVGGLVTTDLLKKLEDLNVTDSKKLSHKKRSKIIHDLSISLKPEIVGRVGSLFFYISEMGPEQIDKFNIFASSMMAMKKSCHKVAEREEAKNVDEVFIDGKFPIQVENQLIGTKVSAIIKGDSKSLFIALASIIAKEYRDNLMKEYAIKYPEYGFEKHSGYPTKKHKEAISSFGITPIHRKSFKGVKEFL